MRMGPSLHHSRDRLAPVSTWRGYATLHPLPWLGLASWDWLALICPFQAVPTNHTYKFSYSYHMRPKLFYTYTTLWAHDTLHIHTSIMVSLFVPSRSHQAARLALTPHVGNRNWSRYRHSFVYSIGMKYSNAGQPRPIQTPDLFQHLQFF
jgi:hypothetical protein